MMPYVSAPEERFTFDAGRGEVSAAYLAADGPVLVLAHGAGSGMDHPFLIGFARAMADEGVATMRFNFPYMEAGRRAPDPQPAAIAAWRAAREAAGARSSDRPLFASGKSYGGRMASVSVAEGMPAAGLVFLGYPLHAPGKPDKIRDEHLYGIEVPMLFLYGTRDAFAEPSLLAGVVKKLGPRATLHEVEGGDHSFNVRGAKASPRDVGAGLASIVAAWVWGR